VHIVTPAVWFLTPPLSLPSPQVYFTMDGSEDEEEKKALNRDYV
jgi:hypothetical protein